jgi:hypothetical protein
VLFLGTLGVGPLGDQIGQYTVQLRYQYWLTGIRIGNSSPIWGVGVDSYGDYFRTFRSQSLAETTSIDLTTNNAHNVFVQFYATLGIIGFLALVIPVVLGAYLSIHILMNAKTEKIERGVVSIFLALWAMAFFSIDNIAIAVWNYVFLGLVWGISTRYKNCVIEKDHPRKADSDLDPRKYLASILAAVLFTVSWSSSISDRNLQYFLANPVNPQDTAGVAARNAAILESARRYSVLETELYYLASELNKTNSVSELYELLDYSLEKYPKDFNLLDISAGYREQRGKQVEAIPYRERQLQIEPRHPRIWLSYAYDLRAAGFPDQARDAFEKVKEFQIFLTDDIKQQLPVISKDFNTSSAGD